MFVHHFVIAAALGIRNVIKSNFNAPSREGEDIQMFSIFRASKTYFITPSVYNLYYFVITFLLIDLISNIHRTRNGLILCTLSP